MSKKYKKINAVAQITEGIGDAFENPMEKGIESPFEITSEIDGFIQYSKLSRKCMMEKIDDALDIRDKILGDTLLKGVNGYINAEEAEDAGGGVEVELDDVAITDFYDRYVSDRVHVKNSVWVRGLFSRLRLKYRLFSDMLDSTFYRVTEGETKKDQVDATTLMDILEAYVNNYSKAYALANISEEIQKYLIAYGKENCTIERRITDERYELVLTHLVYGYNVAPIDSQETVLTIPETVYDDLGFDGESFNLLNLAYYDDKLDEWEKDANIAGISSAERLARSEIVHYGGESLLPMLLPCIMGVLLILMPAVIDIVQVDETMKEAVIMHNLLKDLSGIVSMIGVLMLITGMFKAMKKLLGLDRYL